MRPCIAQMRDAPLLVVLLPDERPYPVTGGLPPHLGG